MAAPKRHPPAGARMFGVAALALAALFGPATRADADLAAFTLRCLAELDVQMQVHEKTWGIDRVKSTRIDQGRGRIYWTLADGLTVQAPVQIVGTFNPTTGNFLWSWANHTILGKLQTSANAVRAYGTTHGVERFTSEVIATTPRDAWSLTAIANHLGRSNGAYRADAGGVVVYVTFGKVSLGAD